MRLFLTAALVLVGCGTTTNITNNTTGQTPTCSVTLSAMCAPPQVPVATRLSLDPIVELA